MYVEAVKMHYFNKIDEEYNSEYITGWGDHSGHHVKTLSIDRIATLKYYLNFKIELYCKECDKTFTELWSVN